MRLIHLLNSLNEMGRALLFSLNHWMLLHIVINFLKRLIIFSQRIFINYLLMGLLLRSCLLIFFWSIRSKDLILSFHFFEVVINSLRILWWCSCTIQSIDEIAIVLLLLIKDEHLWLFFLFMLLIFFLINLIFLLLQISFGSFMLQYFHNIIAISI